jgi:uncharacterized protein YggE
MNFTTKRRKAVLASALAALLSLALLVPAAQAAERTVAVGATATLKVPNDTAKIGVSVSRERKSRGAALQAASAGLQSVIAAVQAVPGVGEGDVKTGRIDVRKVIKGKGGAVVYRASEGAGVTLHEPSGAGALVQKALAAGATNVSGPTFSVGDTEAAFTHVLVLAFEKAKARAQALATAAGATLGPVLAVEEGEGAELLPFADKAAGVEAGVECPPSESGARGVVAQTSSCAPAPPTKPGKSQVKATVHVVFELK